LAYGLENSFVFDDFVKTASALGAVNASKIETCDVELAEIEKLVNQIQIIPVGKKMKIIDDSPKY
jgi:hypothetical protein